jgi:hypothetical protein
MPFGRWRRVVHHAVVFVVVGFGVVVTDDRLSLALAGLSGGSGRRRCGWRGGGCATTTATCLGGLVVVG